MSTLGNIVWFVCGGVFAFVGYMIGGLLLCITVVGIPFGIQSMKIGIAMLAPFGKEVVEAQQANSTLRILFNIVWLILFGWEIAVAHLVSALFLAITVVGIPFAKQHIKLVPLSLFPFGRDLRKPSVFHSATLRQPPPVHGVP